MIFCSSLNAGYFSSIVRVVSFGKVIPSFTKYPDDAEFFFTRLVPQSLKLKILNWYAPKSKGFIRPFVKVAKKYNVPAPKIGNDINKGDYTFYTNFMELLGLDGTSIPSNEHYIGPIFLEELFAKTFTNDDSSREQHMLKQHIEKDGGSILLSLGSSGTKELFIKILQTLNKTKYNVIALYASILKEEELPDVNDNIILKKFAPSISELNEIVDLAIIHGGQGTVDTAAYSGKPIIGFPMQFEQHLNLEMLVKHGTAIIASRKYFKEENLLKDISTIFDNYDKYLKNAQNLSNSLPKSQGDKNAVKTLLKILERDGLISLHITTDERIKKNE